MCLRHCSSRNWRCIICLGVCLRLVEFLIKLKEKNHEISCSSCAIILHSTCRICDSYPYLVVIRLVKEALCMTSSRQLHPQFLHDFLPIIFPTKATVTNCKGPHRNRSPNTRKLMTSIEGLLQLVAWVPYYHHTTIISI